MNIKGGRILAIMLSCVMAWVLFTPVVNADVYLNEVLGSTTGSDTEFIELYNSGPGAVDISGWEIELWDSDSGTSYGLPDGPSPIVIPAATSLPQGGYYLLANGLTETAYGVTANQSIGDNSIENSSYTVILTSSSAGPIIDSAFVTDGGVGDSANRAGTGITPNVSIGPDGTFLPAGFYRVGDGAATVAMLEYSPIPAPSATPGAANLGTVATGACCEFDNSCTEDTLQVDCETGGGIWQGADSTCTPDPCGVTGACCSPDFSCTNNLTEAECLNLDPTATWYEGQFCSLICGPTGACCGLDGVCVADVTEAQCTDMQGNSWTEGVGCGSMSCSTPTQQAVIISEYYESAPGNRKALELWNTTGSTISLNGHAIAAYANTATTPTSYFFLDDLQIGPYGTLVLVNDVDDIGNEIAGLDEVYAIEAPGVINFNGDDAVALMFGDVTLTPTILDAFAVPGQRDSGPRGNDPYIDSAWERDCAITVGTSDFDSCNFDGLKECALPQCPPGTPVSPVCTDGTNPDQWNFEGRNLAADNGNHSLGSHLCVAGVGACCDGLNCILTDSATCAGLGGTFYADTPCNPLPCGPTGACCVPNVLCVDDVTESECRAISAEATWYTGGTCAVDCPFTGACCLASNPGTPCACPGDMDLDLDVDINDVPLFVNALLGLGSQACADANGDTFVNGLDISTFVDLVLAETTCQCAVVTEADCTTAGGTYEGDGTTCDPLPCGPTGACCAADFGSCTDDLTVEECAALDGTATWYVGETCAESCVPEIPEGLVINEFWADDNDGVSGPDQAEFIELYCPSCGGANLSGLSVIVVEGDDSTTPNEFRDRRVIGQYDLAGYTMPLDGYFLMAAGTVAAVTNQEVDYAITFGDLQNGAQTYAIVLTSDIAYDPNTQQLSVASVAAITSNLIDGIAAIAASPNNNSYFGAPTLGPMGSGFAPDTASRIPNGVDTDTTGDWTAQDNFPAVLLYDAFDLLSTPGYANTTTILGVCCDGTDTCSELTKADCEDGDPIGGIWQGRFLDKNCSDPNFNPCLPVGACCLPDFSCVLANEDVCINTLSGTYQGDDSACTPDPCAATGSCCLPGTICYDDLTEAECLAISGGATWTEAGACVTDCSGACCTSTGCEDLPRNACLALDPAGVFLGAGTECATATCPAADYCLIISEVVDGDMPQGTPKWIEITNTSLTDDYTFAAGGIIQQSNADTGTAVDVDLTGVTIPAGTSYVVCNSANGGDVQFLDVYGFDADLYTAAFFGNGDDRYALTDVADGTHIIDIYGEFGVDGTGTTWEYTDSFAERNFNVSTGNGGTFDEADWFIAGVASLDGAGDDLLAKALLQNNTSPGTHNFTPCAREIVECTGSCTATLWCQFTVTDPGDCGSLSFGNLICIQCQGECPGAGTDVVFTWIDGNGAGANCTFTAQSIEATTTCKASCTGVRSFEDAP